MKLFLIVTAFAANASMAMAAPTACQDFSGTWAGECTQPAGAQTMTIEQNGCASFQSDGDTILTDGQSHKAEEGQYTARWNTSGTSMDLVYNAQVESLNLTFKVTFVQDRQGKQSIYRKMSRTFAGKTEPLETCSFQRK